jgi:hypothetical protein
MAYDRKSTLSAPRCVRRRWRLRSQAIHLRNHVWNIGLCVGVPSLPFAVGGEDVPVLLRCRIFCRACHHGAYGVRCRTDCDHHSRWCCRAHRWALAQATRSGRGCGRPGHVTIIYPSCRNMRRPVRCRQGTQGLRGSPSDQSPPPQHLYNPPQGDKPAGCGRLHLSPHAMTNSPPALASRRANHDPAQGCQ